jgi:membrane-associated protein
MAADWFSLETLKDIPNLIKSVGMYGVWLIIFLESSFVFFLPGDSLLFMAGFFSSQGYMPVIPLILGCLVGAVVGNKIGYVVGERYGRGLFDNEKGKLFNPRNLARTEEFYAKHGKMAVVIARFLPVVRTFTPVFAGIVGMDKREFFIYNVIGGVAWCGGLIILGYFLGQIIPAELMEKYLIIVVLGIIVLSFLPAIIHFWKEHRKNKNTL